MILFIRICTMLIFTLAEQLPKTGSCALKKGSSFGMQHRVNGYVTKALVEKNVELFILPSCDLLIEQGYEIKRSLLRQCG